MDTDNNPNSNENDIRNILRLSDHLTICKVKNLHDKDKTQIDLNKKVKDYLDRRSK